jgi:hypothetical protein
MNLNKQELHDFLSDALDNSKKQTETNRLNAETIFDLVENNRHLRNSLTLQETKTERYKKLYTELWWKTKKFRDTEAAYEKKINNEEMEH